MRSATRIAPNVAPNFVPGVPAIPSPPRRPRPSSPVYWRIEGSLLELTTVRPIAFFTWNAQTFIERSMRRTAVLMMPALRPFLYALNRTFATRVVHSILRGISRDRLDLFGGEHHQVTLERHLQPEAVRK